MRRIDADGVWLDMGDIRCVIPANSAMKQQFQFGDPVCGVTVEKVEKDGTLVLQADGLELEDDVVHENGNLNLKANGVGSPGTVVSRVQWSMGPKGSKWFFNLALLRLVSR